jgi:NADH-quinone oxidoreductase subunit A
MLNIKKNNKVILLQNIVLQYSLFWKAYSSFCCFRLDNKTYKNVGGPYVSLTLFVTPQLITVEKVEYFKAFNLFLLILIISLLLFGVAYFLSITTIKDSEKLSQYECGFEPFDEATRHPFDVHFYIVGILFLIFDVEIALLFPWVLGLKFLNWFGFFTMLVFLGILTIGFFYEWHRGALTWPQTEPSTSTS